MSFPEIRHLKSVACDRSLQMLVTERRWSHTPIIVEQTVMTLNFKSEKSTTSRKEQDKWIYQCFSHTWPSETGVSYAMSRCTIMRHSYAQRGKIQIKPKASEAFHLNLCTWRRNSSYTTHRHIMVLFFFIFVKKEFRNTK